MNNYQNRKNFLFTNAVPETPKPKSAVPEMDIIPKTVQRKTFTTLANKTKSLITAAQNGNKQALEQLCISFEPLFRSEMRRDMFYNALGFEEGLSLARLKFIELVLTYNGADYEHFAGYVRCRIHFALYDEVKKVSEAEGAEFSDDVIEREELSILLNLALNKLTAKQRQTIEALYINGYSGREAAELLNCSPAMVTKHHKQALKNLRSNIA